MRTRSSDSSQVESSPAPSVSNGMSPLDAFRCCCRPTLTGDQATPISKLAVASVDSVHSSRGPQRGRRPFESSSLEAGTTPVPAVLDMRRGSEDATPSGKRTLAPLQNGRHRFRLTGA